MPGRPKRKARLLREGKTLPSWSKASSGGSRRSKRYERLKRAIGREPSSMNPDGSRRVHLAHTEVAVQRHATSSSNHEIIEGHPSQAPKASPGRGSPLCSTAGLKLADFAYHVGTSLARKHMKKMPSKLKAGQVVVSEAWDGDGHGIGDGSGVETVLATWCDGGRIKTFYGMEGS